MKPHCSSARAFWLAISLAIVQALPAALAQEEIDCRPVVEQLKKNVENAPSHVLTLLEDAVIANGGHCLGDLVQTAIVASKADGETVKKIVFVAITNAPKQAPEIAEAAVAASPKDADFVRAAFAEAFDEKNPRLKPADPAAVPAWEVADSPVTAPKPIPAPASIPTPVPAVPKPAPEPATPGGPVVAAGDPGNPYVDIDNGAADRGWELLHDGVVEGPAAGASTSGEPITPPPPLGEDEATKKGVFGFSLPTLPSLPPVDEPIDLYFSSPFGGIPGPGQGS
jgi:hypothetical protein